MRNKTAVMSLVLIGLLLFFYSFFNDFVWDDFEQILKNTSIHNISNVWSYFYGGTFYSGGQQNFLGIYYKPFMTTVFSIIYTIFGPDPLFFHLVQVFLHIINAILLYYCLKGLFSLVGKRIGSISLISYLVSLVFLIHPINVETVIYISALQDVLFFFFGILSFLTIIYYERISKLRVMKMIKVDTIFWTALLMLASLLSKETGILFVAIDIIFIIMYQKKRLWNCVIAAVSAITIYCILRFMIADISISHEGLSPVMRSSLEDRIFSMPKIFTFYIKTFFFPKDLAISWHWLVTEADFRNFFIPLISTIVFFTIIYISLLKLKGNKLQKLFIFFLLCFLGSMSIHMQVFPLDMTVADRWFYLPSVGFMGMISVVLIKVISGLDSKFYKILRISLVLLLMSLSVRSFIRTLDWRDGYTLYSHDAIINDSSFDLENNLGVEAFRKNYIDEAKKHFIRSIELAPYGWTSWNNLGFFYEVTGELENAKKCYLLAINNGNYYLAYENYARVLRSEGSIDKLRSFLEEKALPLYPENKKLNEYYDYVIKSSENKSK